MSGYQKGVSLYYQRIFNYNWRRIKPVWQWNRTPDMNKSKIGIQSASFTLPDICLATNQKPPFFFPFALSSTKSHNYQPAIYLANHTDKSNLFT